MDDLASDFAWFIVIVSGDGEGWSVCRLFDGSGDFWWWSRRGHLGRRVNEGGGQGGEFVGKDIGSDGRHIVEGV